jgi:hypothetical protein
MVVADPPVDGGKRVVGGKLPRVAPGAFSTSPAPTA